MDDYAVIQEYLWDPALKAFIQSNLSQSLADIGLEKGLIDELLTCLEGFNFKPFSEKYRDKLYELFTVGFLHTIAGKLFSREVIPAIKPCRSVLDIGCGTGTLVELLVRSGSFQRVYGIDVNLYPEWDKLSKLGADIRVVKEADFASYLAENQPDAVVLTWTLHHMNYEEQRHYLEKLRHVLKPRAQVIILEDCYAETFPPQSGESINRAFMAWSRDKRQRIMSVQDWLANRILAQRDKIPMTFAYRTLEEWDCLFRETGFDVIKKNYLGFPKERDINNPQSVFVLERI